MSKKAWAITLAIVALIVVSPASAEVNPFTGETILGMTIWVSPNPVAPGGTASFYATCDTGTDIWDNIGHSGWGSMSFDMAVGQSFTWTVGCMLSGAVYQSVNVQVSVLPPCCDPPPPPPPPTGDGGFSTLQADWFALGDSGWEASSAPDSPTYGPAGGTSGNTVRCKWQNFTSHWAYLGSLDALTYAGTFNVCYVPGKRIDRVKYVRGDAYSTSNGWWWRGNDDGYPSAEVHSKYVIFHFRGSLEFCIYPPACIGVKHPWLDIRFNADNTITREQGVV